MQEELFGPVFVLYSFGSPTLKSKSDLGFNEEDLLNKLNNVDYGLTANLYSSNKKYINEFAKKIDTGSVFLNFGSISISDNPFGGVKKSGFGRECGPFAISTFGEVKSINSSGLNSKFEL
jgi:acyl-CoA reductase-like NAD-dependent aldehyde dehydrogenase